jgi:hypothetical protein
MWKLGLRPSNSFSGNTLMGFLLQCNKSKKVLAQSRKLNHVSLFGNINKLGYFGLKIFSHITVEKDFGISCLNAR